MKIFLKKKRQKFMKDKRKTNKIDLVSKNKFKKCRKCFTIISSAYVKYEVISFFFFD